MTYANYLELFNYVLTHGEKKDNKTYLDNLTAWHEVDGYTCYLGDDNVILTLLFHSRFTFEYQDQTSLASFQKEASKVFSSIKQRRVNKHKDDHNE